MMMLVSEPEAAALFCQYDFLKQQHFSSYEKSYLVVDCGGGTVDIAAHKMTRKGNNTLINELAPPSGGECGGFAINDQFEMLLQNIFGMSKDDFVKLKENYSVHWNKMINDDFEASKLQVDPEKPVPLTVDVAKPVRGRILKITGKNIEDLVQAYGNENIEWDNDDCAIVLNYPAILQLFTPVIDKIYSLINNVLTSNECQCITAVLMVGGFANSKVLFADIKARLKRHYPQIETYCSSDPTFSVVKGAILNAQLKTIIDAHLQNADSTSSLTSLLGSLNMQATSTKSAPPSAVSTNEVTKYLPIVMSRKMKYTIGVEATVLFEEGEHAYDSNKKYFYGGQYYCRNIFNPLVKANENVYIGSSKKTFRFRPLTEEQSKCDITIFATEKENVKYVDDPDCYVRAQVVISDLPRYDTDLSREVELCIDFYETECEISAYSVTAKEHKKVTVDYHFLPNKYLPPST